jgi:hypothetical protein
MATALDRTVLDCAQILNYRQGLILLDHGLRLGCNREWLESACADLAGARGSHRAPESPGLREPIVRVPGGDTDPGRDRQARLPGSRAPAAGPNTPRRLPVRFRVAAPSDRARIRRQGKYFDYKPTAEVIFEERQREKLLTEQGWRILRIDWKGLAAGQRPSRPGIASGRGTVIEWNHDRSAGSPGILALERP